MSKYLRLILFSNILFQKLLLLSFGVKSFISCQLFILYFNNDPLHFQYSIEYQMYQDMPTNNKKQ